MDYKLSNEIMATSFWCVAILCQVLLHLESTTAEEVTVKAGNMKKWFRTSITLDGGSSGQLWTNPVSEGDKISKTSGRHSNFVLLTNHVHIGKTFAELVYVDVEARLCVGSTKCSNNCFQVYIYHGKNAPDIKAYLFPTNFALIYNITDSTASELSNSSRRTNHTFTFPKNGSEGVTFGIRSTGSCGETTVYRMKIYYYYCKKTFIKSVEVPNTISPSSGSKEVIANCSKNSSPSRNERTFKGFCRSNGTWEISSNTECLCDKGFESISSKGCLPCPDSHFKANSSNEKCIHCPSNSVSTTDNVSCRCKIGYYRQPGQQGDQNMLPCYSPIKAKLKVTVDEIGEGAVNVSWNEPQGRKLPSETLKYDVECYLCVAKLCNVTCADAVFTPSQYNLTQTFVNISNLDLHQRHVFRVYPKNSLNQLFEREEWSFSKSERFWFKTSREPGTYTTANIQSMKDVLDYKHYIVIGGVACGLLLVVVFILVIFIVKRRRNFKRGLIIRNPNQVELPSVGHRMYIDPTNYENPEDAVTEFASELERSVVLLQELVGGGEFGNVYKGQMTSSDNTSISVAVKTLKRDSTVKSEKDFLLEASVMGQFNDPNVVRLEGVVTKSIPRMIVLEYMSNGSLDHYLMNNDGILSQLELIGMARGVASGMAYLSGINFVHRDLAARNILVNEDLLCKISDFGLSRILETDGSSRGEYSTSGGKIPIRWTAPEAIKYRKFSSASDVWSYGILLWEIMSFANRPYGDWDNFRVMREVDEGFRLSAPMNCPKAVHDLMLQCWSENRSMRPSFVDITLTIDKWIFSPATMDDALVAPSSLSNWLRSIKMGSYESLFSAAGYKCPSDLSALEDQDLREMGITLIGHRNKILKGIRAIEFGNGQIPYDRTASLSV